MSEKKPTSVIVKRELSSFFTSPVAYITGALFLLFSGFLFFNVFFLQKRAEMRMFFQYLPILLSFFIPALTMRVFSEEKHSGSLETLITLPVSSWNVVLGKFLAVGIFCIIMIVPTLFYVFTCAIFGNPDPGPIIGGYCGAVLLSGAFCAIGIWASSVTKNQIVAFFIAFTACILLALIDQFLIFLPAGVVRFFQFISAGSHFTSISRGIIDSRDVVYFLSLIVLFLIGTEQSLERRRIK